MKSNQKFFKKSKFLPVDNFFDIVYSKSVIEHFHNPDKLISEMYRVLKPGGELRIMLYHSTSFYNWVNVILRYGILQGKLLHMSVQDLHNRYTDGKKIGGAPLAKYYSRKEVARTLFPTLTIKSQISSTYNLKVNFLFLRNF